MSRFARSFLALLALGASAPALAGPLADGDKMAIMADVNRGADTLAKNALQIWNYAEIGFQETKSSALLQQQLKAAGFTVEAGIAKAMPTLPPDGE